MTTHQIASPADIREFKSGLENYAKGAWFLDRWKTFRLRFGIYEQRQAGEHMVRAKVPGGRLTLDQARAIAKSNTEFGGGDIHVTTRQGVQFYFIKQNVLGDFLESLSTGGVSTREASGNTFRAITACSHAGFCDEQHVDAADVASRLTQNLLRNPLVQHMPRKFKSSVSGCARDCGLTHIDDLGFIAEVRGDERGFRVVAGGGLGIQPTTAIKIFDFIPEHDIPRVQEAVARLHIKSSTRTNKNRSRIKFLVRKWGADAFVQRVHTEFKALEGLAGFDGAGWRDLDWGTPQNIGRAVEVEVPLGWLTSAQMQGLADLAGAAGGIELRLTRTQNIIAPGLDPVRADGFIDAVRMLGLDASGREHVLQDLVVCPGTTTCAIGITDSHSLGESLVDAQAEFSGPAGLKVRVSGCHNSCAQHHIADIGFHGVAKKIDGQPAPHYQLHLGGSAENHGVLGPVFAVRQAKDVLKVLLSALDEGMAEGETVRAWADRLGTEGITELLAPVLGAGELDAATHTYDLGSDHVFVPPATSSGECAAGALVAEHFADLAQVARADAVRLHAAGRAEETQLNLRQAVNFPAQRLLVIAGKDTVGTAYDDVVAFVREEWSHNGTVMDALNGAIAAIENTATALQALPALAAWQNVADAEVERILSDVPGYMAGAAE